MCDISHEWTLDHSSYDLLFGWCPGRGVLWCGFKRLQIGSCAGCGFFRYAFGFEVSYAEEKNALEIHKGWIVGGNTRGLLHFGKGSAQDFDESAGRAGMHRGKDGGSPQV
jgi:hypothetical protein